MSQLKEKRCKPCEGGVRPLKGKELQDYLEKVDGWEAIDEHHIKRNFKFDNYKGTLDFVNKVAGIAEDEDHHPDICFTWGKAEIKIYTHAIDGLSENDFILAAKIDDI